VGQPFHTTKEGHKDAKGLDTCDVAVALYTCFSILQQSGQTVSTSDAFVRNVKLYQYNMLIMRPKLLFLLPHTLSRNVTAEKEISATPTAAQGMGFRTVVCLFALFWNAHFPLVFAHLWNGQFLLTVRL
jgi:hypothetical protein